MPEAGIEPGPPDRDGVNVAMRDCTLCGITVVHTGATVNAAQTTQLCRRLPRYPNDMRKVA